MERSAPSITCALRSLQRRLGILALSCAALALALPGAARASSDCDQFSGSIAHVPNNVPALTGLAGLGNGNNLQPGDVITLKLDNAGGNAIVRLMGTNNVLIPYLSQSGETATFTIPQGYAGDGFYVDYADGTNGLASWFCTSVSKVNGLTPSRQLTAMQKMVTPIVALGSAEAVAGATSGAIDAAFAGPSSPATSGAAGGALGYAASPTGGDMPRLKLSGDGSSLSHRFHQDWTVWADVRGRGWRETDGPTGQQVNVTAGIGRQISPDWVIGLLGGYEQFRYDVAAFDGRFSGRGGSFGAYSGVRLSPTLRWNTTLVWSRLGYDAQVPLAAGGFAGSRWIANSSLIGNHRWSSFIVEPSITLTGIWEHQGSWLDSAGGAHDSQTFSGARVSAGGKIIAPWRWDAYTLAPYAGLYSDYSTLSSSIGDDVAVPVTGRGWSARLTSGLSIGRDSGGTLAIGGDLGGLGAGFKTLSGHARLAWPF
jgi:hypothetical protein